MNCQPRPAVVASESSPGDWQRGGSGGTRTGRQPPGDGRGLELCGGPHTDCEMTVRDALPTGPAFAYPS